MRLRMLQQPRECGECTLCCKVLGVTELQKNPQVWCRYAGRGTGCEVYSHRPPTCVEFRCLWLDGMGTPKQRPDKVHGVLSTTNGGEHVLLFEDQGYRGVARQMLADVIQQVTAGGEHGVVVLCGDQQQLLGTPGFLEKTKLDRIEGDPHGFAVTRLK